MLLSEQYASLVDDVKHKFRVNILDVERLESAHEAAKSDRWDDAHAHLFHWAEAAYDFADHHKFSLRAFRLLSHALLCHPPEREQWSESGYRIGYGAALLCKFELPYRASDLGPARRLLENVLDVETDPLAQFTPAVPVRAACLEILFYMDVMQDRRKRACTRLEALFRLHEQLLNTPDNYFAGAMAVVTAHVLATCSYVAARQFHSDLPRVVEQAAQQLLGAAEALVEAAHRVRLDNAMSRACVVVWMLEAAEVALDCESDPVFRERNRILREGAAAVRRTLRPDTEHRWLARYDLLVEGLCRRRPPAGPGSARNSRRAERCPACSVGLGRRERWELLGRKAWPRAMQAADIATAGEESASYCKAIGRAAPGSAGGNRAVSCRA